MQKVELEQLFKSVYEEFNSIWGLHRTFRNPSIDDMEEMNLNTDTAEKIYDEQADKLKSLLSELTALPETTPAKISMSEVANQIQKIKKSINSLLNLKNYGEFTQYAWENCTFREASIQVSADKSMQLIDAFVKKNNILFIACKLLPPLHKNNLSSAAKHFQNGNFGGFTAQNASKQVIAKQTAVNASFRNGLSN